MTNEKWLSSVAKSGEYNDLINKPSIVSNIDANASEKSLASAKSVKVAYDKAVESLNIANTSKTKIATSLNSMGVVTDEKDTFDTLAQKIKTIKTGIDTNDATATAGNILAGQTAYVKGTKVTGTMTYRGAVTSSLNAGGTFTIPSGYHDGKGIITANSLASQTGGTASADKLLADETAWVNGNKITGTLKNMPAITSGVSISESEGTVYCRMNKGAYLTEAPSSKAPEISYKNDVVAAGLKITADKILKGKTVLGIAGTGDNTGDATATADKILNGETAYVKGAKVTGTMVNNGAISASLIAGGSYTIPSGYHDGKGVITAKGMESQTDATATASDIISGKTAYVKGAKLTGTMANNGAISGSLNAGETKTIPAGYTSGGTITANSLASQTDATATAGNILSGQTAYVKGAKLTGTMTNNGAVSGSLNAGETKSIPAGYTSGGTITANSLSSQTSGTATAGNILSGQTAWVNGSKITGSMANMPAITSGVSISESEGTVYCRMNKGAYLTEAPSSKAPEISYKNDVVATGLKITADKILKGKTVLGVVGTGDNTGDATATAGNILSGQTAYVKGSKLTGTMANNGAVSGSLNAGETKTIPAGYTSGGTITANSLASQTSGTAVDGNILSGQTAWVNGNKVTGTMTYRGAVSSSLNAGGTFTIPSGFHDGKGVVTANSLSSQTGGTATADKILTGQTAWVNGSKVNGTMKNNGKVEVNLNGSETFMIPAGYHDGTGKVYAYSVASQTEATATAGDILTGQTAWVNGSKITGSMKNLTNSSNIMHEQGNTTKVIGADDLFIGNNTDGKRRVSLRYNGENGFITGNTLFGLEESVVAIKLGISANKIIKGQSICGVNGNATLTDANNGINKIPFRDLYLSRIISETEISNRYVVSCLSTSDAYYFIYYRTTSSSSNGTKYYAILYKYDKSFNKTWSRELGEVYMGNDLRIYYSSTYNMIYIGGGRFNLFVISAAGSTRTEQVTGANYVVTGISFSNKYLAACYSNYIRFYPLNDSGVPNGDSDQLITLPSGNKVKSTAIIGEVLFASVTNEGLIRYNIVDGKVDTTTKRVITTNITADCFIYLYNDRLYILNGNNVDVYRDLTGEPVLDKSFNIGLSANVLMIGEETGNSYIYGLSSPSGGTISKTNINTGEIIYNKSLSCDGYKSSYRNSLIIEPDYKLMLVNETSAALWVQYVDI